MAWYNDILGTGANIFGAGPSDSLDVYKQTPGLLPDPDMQKAQKQSLVRGLLGTAVSYLSQPKNQGYGSALPYLGKAFQAGMSEAQKPYDELENAAKARQALNTAKLQDQYIQSQTMKNVADARGAGVPKSRLITQAELDANTFGPLPKQENGENAVWYLVDGKPVNVAKPSTPLVNLGQSADVAMQTKAIDFLSSEGDRVSQLGTRDLNLQNTMDLADLASTGVTAELRAKIANVAEEFGVKIKGSSDKDYVNALSVLQVKNALANKPAGSGAMSDKDFENLMKTTMSANNPKLTNDIIAYMEEENLLAERTYLDALYEEAGKGLGLNVFQFRAKWMNKYRKDRSKVIKDNISKMKRESIPGYKPLEKDPIVEEIISNNITQNNNDIPD